MPGQGWTLGSTDERTEMSRSKTIKRIALFVTASLGFGLMSVVPASAAISAITAAHVTYDATVADISLTVSCTALNSKTPTCTVKTTQDTVAFADLALTVVGTYAAAADTYQIHISTADTATTAALSAGRNATSGATAATGGAGGNGTGVGATSTRVIPTTTGTVAAIPAAITTTTIATSTSGATYYIYVRPDADDGNYVAADDAKITLVATKVTRTESEADELTSITLENNAVDQIITQREDVATGSTNLTVGIDVAAGIDADDSVTLRAAFSSRPAASSLTNANLTFGVDSDTAALDDTTTFSPAGAGQGQVDNTAGTGSAAGILQMLPDAGAKLVDDSDIGEFAFTPDVPGTYIVRIWHDANSNLLWDSTEATRTVTVYAGAEAKTMTVTQFATTSGVTGTFNDTSEKGSLMLLTFADASGNATTLAAGEGVTITSTGSATLSSDNFTTSVAGSAGLTLTSSTSPNAWGRYRINVKNTVAETVTLTLAGAGSIASNITSVTKTVTFVALTDEDAAPMSNAMTSGTDATAVIAATSESNGTDIAGSSATKTYTLTFTSAAASTSARYVGLHVYDTTGAITGFATAQYVDVVSISGTLAGTATKSFTAQYWSATKQTVTQTAAADKFVITSMDSDGTVGNGLGAEYIATARANNGTNSAFNVANVAATAGGTVSVTFTLKDQFAAAYASQAVTFSIAGRNALNTAATAAVTDANGQATFTYTDIGTSTSSATDTITVSGVSGPSVSVSFGADNAVSTVTSTAPDEDSAVAGTVFTEITSAAAGATGTFATVTATVKNAAGTALAGVAVTCAVSGLTGAEVHTTYATQYTGAAGTSTCRISSYAEGKATVTLTAGGKSATDSVYFRQTGVTEARTIAVTSSANSVFGTVKDRYGNPIGGVKVLATRTGGGTFANGAASSEANTDAKGVVEFVVTPGATATVVTLQVGDTTGSYGETADSAGYVGGNATTGTAVTATAAGTSATAQKGLGASLAPAGVNSGTATVAIAGPSAAQVAADAAADAAAEAIDAANAATDAANLAAEAADAATVAAEEARDAADAATAAVEALAAEVATLMAALKAQITTLANTVAKIAKKVKA